MTSMRMLCLLLLFAASHAGARVDAVEGVRLPHARVVDGTSWWLSGAHVSRWAGLLKVSVGALWLPPAARGRDVLAADVGKQLEIHYLVSIPGQRLRDGTWKILARNLSPEQIARERAGLDTLVDAFADVAPGDRYTLTYVPGDGVRLALNGREVAHVPRDAVAAAIFAVWLGSAPLDAEKKRALLAFRHVPPERAAATTTIIPESRR